MSIGILLYFTYYDELRLVTVPGPLFDAHMLIALATSFATLGCAPYMAMAGGSAPPKDGRKHEISDYLKPSFHGLCAARKYHALYFLMVGRLPLRRAMKITSLCLSPIIVNFHRRRRHESARRPRSHIAVACTSLTFTGLFATMTDMLILHFTARPVECTLPGRFLGRLARHFPWRCLMLQDRWADKRRLGDFARCSFCWH